MAAINEAAFAHLRWSVFEDVSTICIADESSYATAELTPVSTRYAVALGPAFAPPVHEIYLTAEARREYEVEWDEAVPEDKDDVVPPATLWDEVAMRRSDGDLVLAGDVVVQLATWFQKLQKKIPETPAPHYNVEHGQEIYTPISKGAKVFFQRL